MIIVSQDRKAITQDMEIHIRECCNKEPEGFAIENSNFILARYKTEERAIAILEDIVNKYLEYTTKKNVIGEVEDLKVLPKAYIMPEE